MELRKIRVDAVLYYKNGTHERKEFEFEKLGQLNEKSLVQYIIDYTTNCSSVVILDVWHELKK